MLCTNKMSWLIISGAITFATLPAQAASIGNSRDLDDRRTSARESGQDLSSSRGGFAPWWIEGPAAIATAPFRIIGAPLGYGMNVTSSHAQWCESRYRTYDPATDMYMSYNGPRHCNSPYR